MTNQGGKLHIVVNFIIAYIVLTVVVTTVFALGFYTQFSHTTLESVRTLASESAYGISQTVNFSGIGTLQEESQDSDPIYQRIFTDLKFANDINNSVTYVYTMRPGEGRYWEFVVDATVEEDANANGMIDDDESRASISEPYDVSCCVALPIGLTGPVADPSVTSDQWGNWISGYAPIYDEQGKAIAIVGVDISVDEYVTLQSSLRRIMLLTVIVTVGFATLLGFAGAYFFLGEEKRVHHALEIRNADLERVAERRTRALREFMAVIIHDLKSPLTSMRWGLETLKNTKMNAKELSDYSDELQEVVENMRKIVQSTIDATRISLGKLPINKKFGNITSTVLSAVNAYKPEAEAKGLDLVEEFDKKIPKLDFDPDRILNVINNLVSNAIKYSDKGRVTVRMIYLKEQKRVRVEVEDTGIGISKSDIKKLFTPFTRVGGKQSQERTGTGLGLSIVKGVIEGHGGSVGAESTKGKGSTFWFELPIRSAKKTKSK